MLCGKITLEQLVGLSPKQSPLGHMSPVMKQSFNQLTEVPSSTVVLSNLNLDLSLLISCILFTTCYCFVYVITVLYITKVLVYWKLVN